MIATLLRRHLRHQRILIGVMMMAMMGFEVLIISIGSAMDKQGTMTTIIETLPPFLQKLIKTQIGEVAFPGFPAFAFEHPATMGVAIAYVVFLATIPAGERDSGLTDLFLARPLRRWQYLSASVAHIVSTAIVVPCCLLAGTALGLVIVENPRQVMWTDYIPAAFGLMSLLLAWGGIALFMGTGRQRRGVTVVQLVFAIAVTFLVHMLGMFSTAIAPIAWISPFSYFNPIATTIRDESCVADVVTLCCVFGVCTGMAFVRFDRRDI
jgi:putative exporter of polyketide antibiotics